MLSKVRIWILVLITGKGTLGGLEGILGIYAGGTKFFFESRFHLFIYAEGF